MKETLSVPFEVKFLGATEAQPGEFNGYGSVFSVVDDGGDRILPGAFAASLASYKAQGRSLSMYMQHGPYLGGDPRPVGVWNDVGEDSKGLAVKGKLVGLDTETGKYNHALVKEGAMTGLSIEYKVVKADYGKKPGEPRRTIREAKLFGISLVDQPMNAFSRVTGIKSIEDLLSLSEAEDYLKSLGLSNTQATAFLSHIKRLGLGDPAGGHGPGDPDDDMRELAEALKRRGLALT